MEEQKNIRIITLKDLWSIFVHRLWIILLAGIIAFTAFYTVVSVTYEPKYNSSATLYIIQQNQNNTNPGYDDFNLALKVVNDCTHLIKSHSVLETVIQKLKLDISYEELYRSVKITNPAESRILEIQVESTSPQQAKTIVDEICTIGTEKITEAMGFKQVNFYEKGVLNNIPCNKTSTLVYIIVGLLEMALIYSVFLLIYIFDDNIRTDEDIRKYLNLSILGDIPYVDDNKNKKHHNKKMYRNKYYR